MADREITNGFYKGFQFHTVKPARGDRMGIAGHDVNDERRLQVSERPMVDGGDVEDLGAKPRTFSADVIFYGDDYRKELAAFMAVLNDGKTGTLTLPDLEKSVQAKFQKASRKSGSEGASLMTVQWIEDKSTNTQASNATANAQAAAALSANNPAAAIPTIQDLAAKTGAAAAEASSTLTNNAFVKALQTAENSVTNARQQVNSVLNIPRNARQNILSIVGRVTTEINGLNGAINGLLNFTDLLSLSLTFLNPTRVNSSVGKIDFAKVDDPSITVVSGNAQVVTTPAPLVPVQSFADAVKKVQASFDAIQQSKTDLDAATGGNTTDFDASATILLNAAKDLLVVLKEKPTRQVLTIANTSLLEVCFNNGLTVDDIDRAYRLNTNLSDILDIPALTVVNL